MSLWETLILESIKLLGGKAGLQQIYERLYALPDFRQLLTDEHLRITYGRPAWHHQVRRRITNLRRAGELKRILRGQPYSLTEKGIKRIDNEKGKKDLHGRLK